MWAHDTGVALGTLEQGLPGGAPYERKTRWHFPVDPYEQTKVDIQAIEEAMEEEEEGSDASGRGKDDDSEPGGEAKLERAFTGVPTLPPVVPQTPEEPQQTKEDRPSSAANRGADSRMPSGMKKAMSTSSLHEGRRGAAARYLLPVGSARTELRNAEWLVGPLDPKYAKQHLPPLRSGMPRPEKMPQSMAGKGDLVQAARRLYWALENY